MPGRGRFLRRAGEMPSEGWLQGELQEDGRFVGGDASEE